MRESIAFWKEVPATITYIDLEGDAYVHYTFENVSYDVIVYDTFPFMGVGDELTIYLNPSHPDEIFSYPSEGLMISLSMISFSLAFMFAGSIPIFRIHKYDKLIKSGDCYISEIIDVIKVKRRKRNGKRNTPSCYIICECEINGIKYRFKSINLYDILGYVGNIKLGQKVPVYVNPNNFNKYYVDVTKITQTIEIEEPDYEEEIVDYDKNEIE